MVLPASPLSPTRIPRGDSVLIVGPPMTGKRGLVLDALAGGPDHSGVVATTKADAGRVRREFGERVDGEWALSVVDCVSQGGFAAPPEDDDTRYVSTPADLTGIGIAVSGFMQACYHDGTRRRSRVGFHSLSTLLMYADVRRVYQFVHVLTTRIQSAGFVGAFALDTSTGGADARERLTQLFDAVVETRDGEAGPELRVRGGDFGPRSWTAVDPV